MIAPAYGGSHEPYVEGVTGTAPADESAQALTRIMHDLLKDPARLEWMGGHAAQWSRQAFESERYPHLAVRVRSPSSSAPARTAARMTAGNVQKHGNPAVSAQAYPRPSHEANKLNSSRPRRAAAIARTVSRTIG